MIGIGTSIVASRPAGRAWWRAGAAFAADFVNGRYMRAGANVARAQAAGFTRASAGWARDSRNRVIAFGPNEMRLTDLGLFLEGTRTRLSQAPLGIGSSPWAADSGATVTILPPDGDFPSPARIHAGSVIWSRYQSAAINFATAGRKRVKVRYRPGSSGSMGIYLRDATAALQSVLAGSAGSLAPTPETAAGTFTDIADVRIGENLYEVEADFIPHGAGANWRLGLSPRSTTTGEHVDVLGAMLADGGGPTEWIFGEPSAIFTRSAGQLTLHLPDGAYDLVLRFHDDSTHDIAEASGDYVLTSAMNGKIITEIIAS